MSKQNKITEFLGARHPFEQMSESAFERISNEAELRAIRAGEFVYQMAEVLDGIFVVRSGMIEISDQLGDVISQLGSGNSFGERGLFREGMAVTNAKALEDAQVICLPAALVHDLMKSEKAFRDFYDKQRQAKKLAQVEPRSTLAIRRLGDLMTSPVVTVTPDTTIQAAAKLMGEKRISCLLVEDAGKMVGIFTLRDLAYKVIAGGMDADVQVREIMTADPIAFAPEDIANDAIMAMARFQINHVPIVDDGVIVGVLSKSNLLTREALSSMSLVLEISKASELSTMIDAVDKLPLILSKHAGAGTAPHIITRLLTDIADACTRRLIALYQAEHGNAHVRFVWAACGSQGRQEQTGISDQDNCIIFEEGGDADYFAGLAKFVCDGLDKIGYFNCPGDMMATNPMWCQPPSVWKNYFANWIAKPTGEAQMLASVMFDLRAIDGDGSLLEDMLAGVLETASANSIFLGFMIANSLSHQPPLSLFRGFATIRSGAHKDKVDLKHNGVVPITDLARVYAIEGRLAEVNTRRRLELAVEAGVLSSKGGEDLISAYDFISELRLRHQMRQIREGQKPDNYLAPSSLSELERSHLRDAFVLVKSMQSAIRSRSTM